MLFGLLGFEVVGEFGELSLVVLEFCPILVLLISEKTEF
jgi:hypothetical protein